MAHIKFDDVFILQLSNDEAFEDVSPVEQALFQLFFAFVADLEAEGYEPAHAAEEALLSAQGLLTEAFFYHKKPASAPENMLASGETVH